MPLYEYECESCHNRFERIQKSFSDPPIETCPACGKGPVKKLISSPAIQFKGTGWYITDYAKKSSSDGGSAGSKGPGDKKSESKSESGEKKPESKSESTTKSDTSNSSSSTGSGTTKSDT
jgi:putative FmdB family regulatory protein